MYIKTNKLEKFIAKAQLVFGDLYNYSNVEYINNSTNISIICKIHGEFLKSPAVHLNGSGCPICLQQTEGPIFIAKAQIVHNNRYIYDNVIYTYCYDKVNITCFEHGDFSQKPLLHLKGQGCPICVIKTKADTKEARYGNRNYNNTEKRIATNQERYGVDSPFQLESVQQKIKDTNMERYGVEHPLQSPEIRDKLKQTNMERYGHENYQQSDEGIAKRNNNSLTLYGTESNYYPQHHLREVMPKLLDKDWMYNEYVTLRKSPTCMARELNISSNAILMRLKSYNIDIRYTGNYSYISIEWLESIMQIEGIFIQHAENIGEYTINFPKYFVDGYCATTNTIYEFHGDIFHGNPNIFEPHIKCSPFSDLTAGELFQKTIDREQTIRDLGYNLVVMWEADYSC